MSNRSYKRSGGKFSSFASALIGAIVGGFVVYFLLSGAKDNSKTNVDKNIDNQPKKEVSQTIDIKENESMESVVVKKSIDSLATGKLKR